MYLDSPPGLECYETARGETVRGKTISGKTVRGETVCGKTACGETVRGEISVHRNTQCQTKYILFLQNQKSTTKKPGALKPAFHPCCSWLGGKSSGF